MQPRYLKTFYTSFYSASAYRNALENWQGLGLKYLFIVSVIIATLSSFVWVGAIGTIIKLNPEVVSDRISEIILSKPDLTFEENINRDIQILSQIPKLRLEHGEIYTDASQPYSITDPASGHTLAIIDTTGKYTSLENTDASLLITKDTLIVSNADTTDEEEQKVISLRDINKNYGIDEVKVNETLFILEQIPVFGLKNGKFFTEDNKLYTIMDPKGAQVIQIGDEAKLNEESHQPMLAISQDGIGFKTTFAKDPAYIKATSITEESTSEFFRLVTLKLRKYMLIAMPIFGIFLILFSSLMFFVIGSFMLIFYSSIGYLFVKTTQAEQQLNFSQVCRISAVAITPVWIMSTILPHIFPSQWFVYFLITIGYLYFAMKSVTIQQVG